MFPGPWWPGERTVPVPTHLTSRPRPRTRTGQTTSTLPRQMTPEMALLISALGAPPAQMYQALAEAHAALDKFSGRHGTLMGAHTESGVLIGIALASLARSTRSRRLSTMALRAMLRLLAGYGDPDEGAATIDHAIQLARRLCDSQAPFTGSSDDPDPTLETLRRIVLDHPDHDDFNATITAMIDAPDTTPITSTRSVYFGILVAAITHATMVGAVVMHDMLNGGER